MGFTDSNMSRRGFIKTGAATAAILAFAPEKLHAAVDGDDRVIDLKRVVLGKNIVNGVNILTQDMISQSNSIYIIQYDYVANTNITVPANCVLQFEGGSIGGKCILTGTNTKIQAPLVKIFKTNLVFAGRWSIEWAYPEWVGGKADDKTVDNSLAINYLKEQGFPIRIPRNHYYCKTPIFLQNVPFALDGIIEYNGSIKNITFITFYRYTPSVQISLVGQIRGNKGIINYSKRNNSNLVGLHFRSCNNNQIYIASIHDFNIGIKISDYDGIGCCYNQFYIGEIWNTNKAIFLTWGEAGNHDGWANENSFIGGRYSYYSSLKIEDYYDFYVEKGRGAAYGGVDSLKVVRASFETNRRIPVHLEHCIDSTFIDCRSENCTAFIEADIDCHNIYHRTLAGPNKCIPIDPQKGYQASTKESFKLALSPIAIDNTDWVTIPLFNKRVSDRTTYLFFADGITLSGFPGTRFFIKFTRRYNPNTNEEVVITDAERALLPTFYNSYYNPTINAIITGGSSGCLTYAIPNFITEIQVKTQEGRGEVLPLKYDWEFKNWSYPSPRGVCYE